MHFVQTGMAPKVHSICTLAYQPQCKAAAAAAAHPNLITTPGLILMLQRVSDVQQQQSQLL